MSDIGKKFVVTARPFYGDGATTIYHDTSAYYPGLAVGTVVTVTADVDSDGDVNVEYLNGSRTRTAYVSRGVLTPEGTTSPATPVATITRAALLAVLDDANIRTGRAGILADAAEHRSR